MELYEHLIIMTIYNVHHLQEEEPNELLMNTI